MEASDIATITKDRVYVKTADFEGYATVQHVIPGEMYPIQVELEKPDENGQSIQRIKADEIVRDSTPKVEPQRYIAKVNKYRNGYTIGDKYIVGQSKNSEYFNVYLMDGRIIGSYIHDFFEKIEPYTEPVKTVTKEPKPIPKEPIEPVEIIEPVVNGRVTIDKDGKQQMVITSIQLKKEKPTKPKKKKQEVEIPGQMTMFDFL